MKKSPCIALMLLMALAGGGARLGAAAPEDARQVKDKGSGQGWLGVTIQDMTPRLARTMHVKTEKGALVGEVLDESPAEEAGIKDEDIVTEFDGKAVSDADGLRSAVRQTAPETEVTVVLARRDERISLKVKVGKAPRSRAVPLPPMPRVTPHVFRFETSGALGMKLLTLNEQLGKYFQAPGGRGVLIEEVEEESEAAKAGFQAGDVITAVGKEPVEEVRDVRRALRNAAEGESVAFEVLRRGITQKLSLVVDEQERSRGYRFHLDGAPRSWWFERFDGPELEEFQLDLERIHPDLEGLRRELKHLKKEIKSSIRQGLGVIRETRARSL